MLTRPELLEDFLQGRSTDAYKYMGCQFDEANEVAVFRVYAPRAERVTLVGDFNEWDRFKEPLKKIGGGVWELRRPGIKKYDAYKFYIEGCGKRFYKSDPYAFHSETMEKTASKVYPINGFSWNDSKYMEEREKKDIYRSPINIYEAHIGSWKKHENGSYYSYRDFADNIVPYLKEMNFTHLELMGIAEYPFDGSWGYQVTSYFAPTSRYGTPADFVYLVDKLHTNNIAVILDWVPGHFPKNDNGLYEFDGAPLYEPADELMKEHKEWGTRCFDYSSGPVKSFLISNAMMWLNEYHIDGLRVDAVASMLYRDYGRTEWRRNCYGGRENLEAVEFFRQLNTAVFGKFGGIMMIAEESTAWPLVTKPVNLGGLGFNFKWNMGWMNDTLSYAKTDPLFRAGSHNKLTFSMTYAFSENYILPVSHDEVVHGKGSLLNKMPGDYDTKFAGLRNYLMSMYAHPGKKLLFMGAEIGQFKEWAYMDELDWLLLDYEKHRSVKEFMSVLSGIYISNAPLYEIEDNWEGFNWVVPDDKFQNIIVFERYDKAKNRLLAVFNFSAADVRNYRFGAGQGTYTEILRSDLSGWTDKPVKHKAGKTPSHGREYSIVMDIPAMSGIYFTAPPIKETAVKSAKKTAAQGAKKQKS